MPRSRSPPAPRQPPRAEAASASSKAARYLLGAQGRDGGFGAAPGRRSSQLYSGWAALGLASARHNPRDVHRRGGRSITSYVSRSAGSLRDIGEIERTILVLEAAGLNSRRFRGRDLVATVRARRRGDGSIAGFVSYTAFGVLALKSAGQPAGGAQTAYLRRAQNGDGGFGVSAAAASDTDMTGAVLQALAAARALGGVEGEAVRYLRGNQNGDGGFGSFRGRSSNAQSTAYAVQGLVAARAAPDAVGRAVGYLRGLQRRDGSIAYSRASAQTPVWVTAQALMALRRRPLPIGQVPRRRRTAAAASVTARAVSAKTRAKRSARGRAAAESGPAGSDARAAAAAVARLSRLETRRRAAYGSASAPAAATAGGDGPGGWLIAVGALAAAVAVVLVRRRLIPTARRDS